MTHALTDWAKEIADDVVSVAFTRDLDTRQLAYDHDLAVEAVLEDVLAKCSEIYAAGRAEGLREATKLRKDYAVMGILLVRFRAAVRALGKFKDGKTLFEGSPTQDQECFEAWQELNDAGVLIDRLVSEIALASDPAPGDQVAALAEIRAIIEAVDDRCMHFDGPVPPTLSVMTQAEISRIYALACGNSQETSSNV